MDKNEIIELARKSMNGDEKAFEELCRAKQKEIIFSAMTILKDYHSAEDVAQEVILSMFSNIRSLRAPEALDSWVYTIMRNKCFKALRKNGAAMRELDINDEKIEFEITEDNREFLPDAYAEDESMSDRLYEIVLALPEKRREAILLYYYEDMSYREIAKVTGVTIKTVAANISRARSMIKIELEKDKRRENATMNVPASETVLGRVLNKQASKLISAESILFFESKWMGSFQAMQFPAAKGVAAGIKAAVTVKAVIATAGIAAAVAGVMIVQGHIDRQGMNVEPYPNGTRTVAESDLIKGREIAFAGGDCECGHVNPGEASVSGLIDGDSSVTWKIVDEDGNTMTSGDGDNANTGIAALELVKAEGSYTLHFTLKDADGNTIKLSRTFEVDPDFDKKYPVA
jgi:RNA polymerase sigma-70 factor (ECF subfamily)